MPPSSRAVHDVAARQTQLSVYLAQVRPELNSAERLEPGVFAAVARYAASPSRASLPAVLHVLHSTGTTLGDIARHLAVTVPPFALVAAHGVLASGFRAEAMAIDRIAHGIRTGARRHQRAELAALRGVISDRGAWRAAAMAYAAHTHLKSPAWLST
jgi:hypothetical protein